MKSHVRSPILAVSTGLLLVGGGLALLAWVLSSINGLYDRLAATSTTLAVACLSLLVAVLLLILGLGVRFMWVATRPGRRKRARASSDPAEAAGQSVEATRRQIDLVSDEIARRALSDKLASIADDLASWRFTIVVFGTGSAGKTSVINALLGGEVGDTDPTVGTTQARAEHAYTLESFGGGRLRLVDTPGLSEIGEGGLLREERARELAAEADLLLFVVDQDLRDIEFAPLNSLARLGKRSVLVLNKRDLYPPEDLEAIAVRLRARVGDFIQADDVVICAAAPCGVTVRDSGARGSTHTEVPPSDVDALAERIARILRVEGRALLARNVLLRATRLSQEARESIHQARTEQAGKIVTRFQWTTAAVMFVNPVPGLGALAAAAINYQMVTQIANAFGTPVSIDHAKRLATELGQVMLKMGLIGVATNILGKALKASVVGYLAGGAIEAITGAYLTRLSGEAFTDYFANEQDWGEGGMQAAVERRFQLERKGDFVTEFVKEAARRVLDRCDDPKPEDTGP